MTPRAVVAACGLYEVSNPERFSAHHTFFRDCIEEVTDAYLHGVTLRDWRTLDLADVVVALEGLSSFIARCRRSLLPCGTWDLLMGDTQRMVKALHRLGSTKSEAREYPRGPHAFHAFVFMPEAARCWKDTFAFLDTHLG